MSIAALAAELGAVAAPAPSEKSWTRYLTERKSVVRMAAPYSLRRRTSSPRLHGAAIQWHRVLVLLGSSEAGPKAHTSRMRNLTITALLLLSCCARFDEAKEREGCQKAHPNDQVAADKCFETSILEWQKAHAWVARITHRRPETP